MIAFLLAFFLTPLGVTQDQQPAPVSVVRSFGRAYDRNGSPWAGAHVVFVSHDTQRRIVRARADDNGKFHAELAPGMLYTAWAWKTEGAGGYRSSPAIVCSGGSPLKLSSAEERHRHVRVRLGDLRDWRDRGPFSLRVRISCAHPCRRCSGLPVLDRKYLSSGRGQLRQPLLPCVATTIDVDQTGGVFAIPSLPGDRLQLSVLSKKGRTVTTYAGELPRPGAGDKDPVTITIDLDYRCGFIVLANEFPRTTPVPVPNASIYELVDGRRIALRRTGATGRAGLELPWGSDTSVGILVERPGFTSTLKWLSSPDPEHGPGRAQFILERGPWRKPRLLLGKKPVAEQEVVAMLANEDGRPVRYRVHSDTKGRFEVPPPLALTTRLSPQQVAALTPKGQRRPWPVALLPTDAARSDIDLTKLVAFEIRLAGKREQLRHAIVELMSGLLPFADVATDAAGRVTILAPEQSRIRVLGLSKRAFLDQWLVVAKAKPEAELAFEYPDVFIEGVVTDSNGKPVPGAELVLRRRPRMPVTEFPTKFALLEPRHTADAQGKFRIPVFRNTTYRIWSPSRNVPNRPALITVRDKSVDQVTVEKQ